MAFIPLMVSTGQLAGGGHGSPPPDDDDLLWLSLSIFALIVFIIVGLAVFA
jgi:hypothetical protein